MSPEYLAGFFDADGSVGIYCRGKNSYQVSVAIANSGHHGKIICQKLNDQFGGALTYCAKAKKDSHRDCFWFRLNGINRCEVFLNHIKDHVIIKKDQVLLCIEFIGVIRSLPRYRNDNQKAVLLDYANRCKLMKKAC